MNNYLAFDDYDNEPIPLKTVELERIQIGLQQVVSQEMVDGQVTVDYLYGNIRVNIRGYVWGERVNVESFKYIKDARADTFKYPKTWWDAFKKQYFPKWALQKWPVEYAEYKPEIRKTYAVYKPDVRAIYPEFRPSVPGQKYRLIAMNSMLDED